MSEKPENWLISLDSDNISMFIKTWFAYLASIHELVINHLENPGILDTLRGDKFFLDKYSDEILDTLSMNQVLKENIIATYNNSKQTILNNYPEYFFQTFYKKIIDINLYTKEEIRIERDEYKFDVSVSSNELHLGILSTSQALHSRTKKVFVQKNISINPEQTHLSIIDSDAKFYELIRNSLKSLLYTNINHAEGTKAFDEIKAKYDSLIQVIMSKIQITDLRNILYKPWYDSSNIIEKDLKIWFHGFCYNLRNVMFHRIIDPFDINWSKTMRTSYQGLRELLMLNIEEIKKQNVPVE